jgi:hypothetical protein
MNKKSMLRLALFLLMLPGLVGCAQAATEQAPPAEPASAALKFTGKVDHETSWTMADLQAMDTISVDTTDKNGDTVHSTGVKLLDLADKAGLQDGVTQLTLVGSDGYEAPVAIGDFQACTECIVAFQDDGSLSAVMPGFSGKTQVKGIVEIRAE